ncbi:MAG: nucleotide exchange factor GrpE [Alphaproteobacteria bacterium]|nr:MAG: nucleotide exchange factor GrpE [Alphaproteobacteria bacterium]
MNDTHKQEPADLQTEDATLSHGDDIAENTDEQSSASACLDSEKSSEEEVEQLRNQLMRALAEAENVRKRALKEKEDALKFGMTGFAREMLAVADNLERALQSLSDSPAPVREGVEMTQKQLLSIFEKFNIKPVDALNQSFDAHIHQAVMEVEDATKTPGTVAMVMQTGYTIQERLLRPAMVSVVKQASVKTNDDAALA